MLFFGCIFLTFEILSLNLEYLAKKFKPYVILVTADLDFVFTEPKIETYIPVYPISEQIERNPANADNFKIL